MRASIPRHAAQRRLNRTAGFSRIGVGAAFALLLAALHPAAVASQDSTPSLWWGRLDVFVWFSNINAESVVEGLVVPIGDSTLRASPAIRAEAGRGRWSVVAEFRRARIAGETPPQPPEGAVTFDLQITDLEAAATFLMTEPTSANRADIVAGARYVQHRQNIEQSGPGARTVRQDWLEPFGGFRFASPLGGPFRFAASGNIGGMGVGSSFTWVVEGELGIRLFRGAEFLTRYRYSQAEYDSGTGRYVWYDGQVQGWLLGLRVTL